MSDDNLSLKPSYLKKEARKLKKTVLEDNTEGLAGKLQTHPVFSSFNDF